MIACSWYTMFYHVLVGRNSSISVLTVNTVNNEISAVYNVSFYVTIECYNDGN